MKKLGIILVFVISIITNIFFGFQKSGFHEDEYYTYYSTNRSIGLYQPDREWQDKQTILDEFAVKPGEGFNYGLVKLVQSWDVHPPLYYWIFHTACSLVPGKFTKWTGILTNLLAFSLTFLVLYLIMERLKVSTFIELLALLFYGVNPQTISCNMLIRMYAWLSLFVALCAYLHVRIVQEEKDDMGVKKYFIRYVAPIVVTSYLGFLTQYFYIFFFVSIGFVYTIWLVFYRKKYLEGLVYVISCGFSLALAVVTYPASVHHLLGGYRGNEAAGSMFDLGNTFLRLEFFAGLLNDYVFGGFFYLVAIGIITLLVFTAVRTRKKKKASTVDGQKKHKIFTAELIILILGTLGYFLLTTKTALLVGSASNRYEMPSYGLIIMIVFVMTDSLLGLIGKEKKKAYRIVSVILVVFAAFMISNRINKRVLFLYPEDTEKIEYAADNHDQLAVVMFNPATPYNVWRLTDELIEYDRVFYMDEENLEPLLESDVVHADKIILYIADDDHQAEAFQNFFSSVEATHLDEKFTADMWQSFEIYK